MHSPGFIKRLLLVVYDGLLMIAAVILTSFVLMALLFTVSPEGYLYTMVSRPELSRPMLELTDHGRNLSGALLAANLFITSFIFYGWFWTHGGQTLGMRAWNLYLIKPDGKFIDWKIAFIRYLYAAVSWLSFGLGFTWILLSKQNQSWHDTLTNTKIVFVPKKEVGT